MPESSLGEVSAADHTRNAPLVLELRLEPGEALKGWVQRQGELEALPFQGWLDLMAAVSTLRAGSAQQTG